MIDALVGLLESLGGEVRCGAPVERVAVEGGRAVGVVVQGGERLSADRAVIANLTPTVLFGGLVDEGSVPAAFMRKVRAYRYGPATMMIHLAMSDLPAWAASDRAREHAYVHIGPYLDDMSLAYLQAVSGYLPPRPTLVVGQPTAVDPTRAPDGKHVLWVQVRMVPSTIRGDAAGEIEATTWDEAKELFADRVMALIEGYAPGMASRVLGRHVMSPDDLERYNSNLVGGDSLGGS
ncbi:MAG: phytoene desaturase family protein, partial [Acidimicrobiia bacterium]